jgi:hypothetical protein
MRTLIRLNGDDTVSVRQIIYRDGPVIGYEITVAGEVVEEGFETDDEDHPYLRFDYWRDTIKRAAYPRPRLDDLLNIPDQGHFLIDSVEQDDTAFKLYVDVFNADCSHARRVVLKTLALEIV